MSDKKEKKMMPNEFLAGLNQNNNSNMKSTRRESSIKEALKGIAEILGALGLFPVFSSPSRSSGYGQNSKGGVSNTPHNLNSNEKKESIKSQDFDPEKAYIQRRQEKGYLDSVGYTKDDLIETEKDKLKRKQEETYFDSLPGYRRKDSERDDER